MAAAAPAGNCYRANSLSTDIGTARPCLRLTTRSMPPLPPGSTHGRVGDAGVGPWFRRQARPVSSHTAGK